MEQLLELRFWLSSEVILAFHKTALCQGRMFQARSVGLIWSLISWKVWRKGGFGTGRYPGQVLHLHIDLKKKIIRVDSPSQCCTHVSGWCTAVWREVPRNGGQMRFLLSSPGSDIVARQCKIRPSAHLIGAPAGKLGRSQARNRWRSLKRRILLLSFFLFTDNNNNN